MKILVTGAAGFIGQAVASRLLDMGHKIWGLDSLNDYYDVGLKKSRLALLENRSEFTFLFQDLVDREKTANLFGAVQFDYVIHLAAQAGVRYSLENPHSYVDNNLVAFVNVLEGCRHNRVKHLVFASSSSVYGLNQSVPFATDHNVDHPVSLYAASKKANELMAHSYAHLYRLPVTGLRFFTVYGPWGRPDMALFLFTRAILQDQPIRVFNHGNMQRDFTYIDDIVEGVVRVMEHIPQPNPDWSGFAPKPDSSSAPYKIYNIGNHQSVSLLDFIALLEKNLSKNAQKELLPMQAGDVQATFANVDDLAADVGFAPSTPIETGIKKFVDWYKGYYGK